MKLVRYLARPMISAVFLTGGFETLRHPHPRAETAHPVLNRVRKLTERYPALPQDPVTLVRINAAVQVGAGAMLATGRLPRLSAAVLAASIVPTSLGGHRFWEHDDPAQRVNHRVHFLKNAAIAGGLLFAAGSADSAGSPKRARGSRSGNSGVRGADVKRLRQ